MMIAKQLQAIPLLFLTVAATIAQPPMASPEAPLKLIQTIALPSFFKGHFDHFGVDLVHSRLFITAEESGSVLVLDLKTGGLIQTIRGFGKPHAVLYRDDIDRLYVTDGAGELKTFEGPGYRPSQSVPLLQDADSIGYDISTKLLYIDNGGKDVHQQNSMLTVVDSESNRKVADLSIAGETLEAMALDLYRPRLYINNRALNQVEVFDRWEKKPVANWHLSMATDNVAMALDEPHQRLFVGCRTGKIIVLDTNTGIELQSLPIASGVDDLVYDVASRRLYASGDGAISVYAQTDADHYQFLGAVPTGAGTRTARLVPEVNRYFVAVPAHGPDLAKVFVFVPVGLPESKPAAHELPAYSVNAAAAEALVRTTLSSHPFLRKMGLHAIAPGQTESVIIANGNATRIGIRTSKSDFEAIQFGNTYCKKIDNGAFYNLKMPMFDAANHRIGMLVMEIPTTSANDDAEAVKIAEQIRQELKGRIPDLASLFDVR